MNIELIRSNTVHSFGVIPRHGYGWTCVIAAEFNELVDRLVSQPKQPPEVGRSHWLPGKWVGRKMVSSAGGRQEVSSDDADD